ncbi:MAG: hypothetical protein ABSG68_25200, partial [Thermoguttaceae bacterium]
GVGQLGPRGTRRDEGFRPAFNVQLATATDSQVITGLDVTNCGGDQGQLAPMVEQHQQRYEEHPRWHSASA